jgi:hypothetical protein
MKISTLGRCPDCGKVAPVLRERGTPAEILPHDCDARACESTGCLVARLCDEMIQFPAGAWYCPNHALLSVATELVALYRVEGGADWTAISELIGEALPGIIDRLRPLHR